MADGLVVAAGMRRVPGADRGECLCVLEGAWSWGTGGVRNRSESVWVLAGVVGCCRFGHIVSKNSSGEGG